MAAVRQRRTKPELDLCCALYANGIRGWRCNYKKIVGRPDLAWPALKVALFVDGAFWHGHPSRHRPGRSGKYWDDKIAGNEARDRRVDHELSTGGWLVCRVWDFEIQRTLPDVVDEVTAVLRQRVAPGKAESAWQRKLVARSPRE
jgi:DNA mismatch endonuclease, patch repair protein